MSLIAYTLLGFPVIISHIWAVSSSSSRRFLSGGDSDRLGDRERRRLSFVSELLLENDCWDVESLMAEGLLTLFRFAACKAASLSDRVALGGGPDNLEVVEAARLGLVEEGREVKLAAFFSDELGVGAMIDAQLTT